MTLIGTKVTGFLRLGKARIYQHAYSWLLAVLLLRFDGLANGTVAIPLLLLLLMVVLCQWSGGAADDLGGFRDGSDARNYAGRPLRTLAKKPLLVGQLSQSEALMFGVVCWLASLAAGLAAAAVMEQPVPWAASLVLIATQTAAVQYSIGLKLSYQPLGLELTIFAVLGCLTLTPYWLIAGELNQEIILVSALFGLWFLMVVCYGNASDRQGDAEVSRRTLAVMLPPAWYKVVLCLLFVGSVTLIVSMFTRTRIHGVMMATMIPVIVTHGLQLYYGVRREDWRKARFLGLVSLDLGCLGLACSIFFS